jgi:hypothetical protein
MQWNDAALVSLNPQLQTAVNPATNQGIPIKIAMSLNYPGMTDTVGRAFRSYAPSVWNYSGSDIQAWPTAQAVNNNGGGVTIANSHNQVAYQTAYNVWTLAIVPFSVAVQQRFGCLPGSGWMTMVNKAGKDVTAHKAVKYPTTSPSSYVPNTAAWQSTKDGWDNEPSYVESDPADDTASPVGTLPSAIDGSEPTSWPMVEFEVRHDFPSCRLHSCFFSCLFLVQSLCAG